jgi:uncharacterized protein YciW
MTDDLIEDILGIEATDALGILRRQRADILRHSQGAFVELVTPAEPGGVSSAERAALALRGALIEGDTALAARLEALVPPADRALAKTFPAPEGEDRTAILYRYADKVSRQPGDCGQTDIDALLALGLNAKDIVAITQLVSFIPYQTRLLAGLRLLQQEPAA